MSFKQWLYLILAAFIGALFALVLERMVVSKTFEPTSSIEGKQQAWYGKILGSDSVRLPQGQDFVSAAKLARPAVVSVQSLSGPDTEQQQDENEQRPRDPFEEFFGIPFNQGPFNAPSESSGSGVILTPDGYIVTNNHVVENGRTIKVILDDKRSFTAKVIGTDPTTDLALLKIEADGLPFARYGNSDQLEIGDWVLAVGNPYDLTQTVTAGIVSAKARNINILRTKSNMQVESFIQTDAAVNPGNSGGALVNLRGELIGINTAIASQTGSYSGYSFAVPVTIVKKVMDDLLKYGEVQRAVLGVEVRDINSDFAKEKGLPDTKGVYINGIFAKSGAADAKLLAGDVIYKINGVDISSSSQMVELIARNRPGDMVSVTYYRKGKVTTTQVRLKSKAGDTKISSAETGLFKSNLLGADLRSATTQELEQVEAQAGVKVIKLKPNGLLANAGVREGFIITALDKKRVSDPQMLEKILQSNQGGSLLEGIYPNGKKAYYAIAPSAS